MGAAFSRDVAGDNDSSRHWRRCAAVAVAASSLAVVLHSIASAAAQRLVGAGGPDMEKAATPAPADAPPEEQQVAASASEADPAPAPRLPGQQQPLLPFRPPGRGAAPSASSQAADAEGGRCASSALLAGHLVPPSPTEVRPGSGAADTPGGTETPRAASEDSAEPQARSPAELREEGNRHVRSGDYAAAAACYERALEGLDGGPRGRALLLGNLSAARLQLGDAAGALDAAKAAQGEDLSFAKAYYREAKALLALRRPRAAMNAARACLFLQGSDQAVEALAREVASASRERRAPPSARRPSCVGAAGSGASAFHISLLEQAPELPALVARHCTGRDLARLGRCARRFLADVATEEAFLQRATALCPQGSAKWLRKDHLAVEGWGLNATWLYAQRSLALACASKGRLAVCGRSGHVEIVDAVPNSTAREPLAAPAGCLAFSLCWNAGGEYVAYTAIRDGGASALVLAPAPSTGLDAVVVPLRQGMAPYYLCPSPCGTRLAMLGALQHRQVLFVADTSQMLAPDRERAPPITLRAVASAAPLYFDWAPHAPEILAAVFGNRICHAKVEVHLEVFQRATEGDGDREACEEAALGARLREPGTEDVAANLRDPQAVLRGRVAFRAPQWIPWPGSEEGRWIVPRDPVAPGGGSHVSLCLVDPADGSAEVVCEHLPMHTHFSASRTGRWVAWSGLHDNQGHGGVFVRRLPPSRSRPLMVFNGNAEALTWGGDRLAMLLTPRNAQAGALVWAVWDPPVCLSGDDALDPADGGVVEYGRLTVAPATFKPSAAFSDRVLPFFDQFERRCRFWNPEHDAVVYPDRESGRVWMQPFPPRGSGWFSGARHPLSDLVGADKQTVAAPASVSVSEGNFACWSPT